MYHVSLELLLQNYNDYGLAISRIKNRIGVDEPVEEIETLYDLSQQIKSIISPLDSDEPAFIVWRRLYSLDLIAQFEKMSLKFSNLEIRVLFNQISYQNILEHNFNEEGVAIEQAAILEAIRLIEIGNLSQSNRTDIHSQKVDAKEINTIYPSQLISFFNRKSVYRKIQEAKSYLAYNTTLRDLQYQYLKLTFEQQQQIGSAYFPVYLQEVSSIYMLKSLKKIMSHKTQQLYLVVSPTGIGFAEDSKSTKSTHKKMRAQLAYEHIEDVDLNGKKDGVVRILYQVSKTEEIGEQLIHIKPVDPKQREEIVYLISDYINYKQRSELPKRITMRQKRKMLNPLGDVLLLGHQNKVMTIREIWKEINSIDRKNVTIETIFQEFRANKLYLSTYLFSSNQCISSPLLNLQKKIKTLKLQNFRKNLQTIMIKIQSLIRGFLVRKRLRQSVSKIYKEYSAILFQKSYRGYILRKKLLEFYQKLINV